MGRYLPFDVAVVTDVEVVLAEVVESAVLVSVLTLPRGAAAAVYVGCGVGVLGCLEAWTLGVGVVCGGGAGGAASVVSNPRSFERRWKLWPIGGGGDVMGMGMGLFAVVAGGIALGVGKPWPLERWFESLEDCEV
jgi:hypothetical protein